ncbi:uncharacterized protein [Parasteatoda tepidariorum]|uniref:uncharacterized protein n=1 Tax=Parasteatoda tepidariorum TaxID=114398 RepID=UPI00077FA907|nr:uncharacterized protein LOC107436116 [Parasteatoda tepidariorum]
MFYRYSLIYILVSSVAYCHGFDFRNVLKTAREQAIIAIGGSFVECFIRQYCDCELSEEESKCFDYWHKDTYQSHREKWNAECDLKDGYAFPEWKNGSLSFDILKPFVCNNRDETKNCLLKTINHILDYSNKLEREKFFPSRKDEFAAWEKYRTCQAGLTSTCMAFPNYCKSDLI